MEDSHYSLETLHKDLWPEFQQYLTPISLSDFFRVSHQTQKKAQQRLQNIKELDDVSYLAEVFTYGNGKSMQAILCSIHAFVNFHTAPPHLTLENFTKALRHVIANKLRPDCTRRLMTSFIINPQRMGGDHLLRRDATFGHPNTLQDKLTSEQITTCLTLITIAYHDFASASSYRQLARDVRNYVLDSVHHNAESQRLGDCVAGWVANGLEQPLASSAHSTTNVRLSPSPNKM